MNLFITIPDFSRHGGIRVIIEWANRLSQWHTVHLHCLKGQPAPDWITINPAVQLVGDDMTGMDALIITSPHSIHFQDRPDCPAKVFLFLQMMEHLFRPDDAAWQRLCQRMYTSSHPLFSISQWNITMMQQLGRTAETIYIGNGVNTDDFPISNKPKSGNIILVEGWEATNPTKDIRHVAPYAAHRLKLQGYRIIAYGATDLRTMRSVPERYYRRPDTATLNRLYEEATILLKASFYDARSCSPMEAMTKGTVTVRAIRQGDDDLIHDVNCIRTSLHPVIMYKDAVKLLQSPGKLQQLQQACYQHIAQYSWDYWMEIINRRISQ